MSCISGSLDVAVPDDFVVVLTGGEVELALVSYVPFSLETGARCLNNQYMNRIHRTIVSGRSQTSLITEWYTI